MEFNWIRARHRLCLEVGGRIFIRLEKIIGYRELNQVTVDEKHVTCIYFDNHSVVVEGSYDEVTKRICNSLGEVKAIDMVVKEHLPHIYRR